MRILKGIRLSLLILCFLVFIPGEAKAEEYTLTKFRIDVKVNEDNTFFITEHITAFFNVGKHGILRKIPLRNNIIRLDGTKSRNRAVVSDINVSAQAATYNESDHKVIKIGDPDIALRGSNDYTISYLYNIGKDTGKGYDEFYFNLVGNEWDTTISNIEFSIEMPKDFDSSKLGFSSGSLRSTDSSHITYRVDGNVITGSYDGTLRAYEALSVRLELPDGYFAGADGNLGFTFMRILLFALPIIFAVISFFLWFLYGKDNKVVETIEFYPPEGFNSAEIGFLYKGKADTKDVVSLLVYLANKGYVRIEDTEKTTLFSTKQEFTIIKNNEYDGTNSNERTFLNGLFKSGAKEITKDDLYNQFYITLNTITANLNSKTNKQMIFEKSTSAKAMAVVAMIIMSALTVVGIPSLEYANIDELIIALFLTLFYMPFYIVILTKKMPLMIRLFGGGFLFLHSMVFFSILPIKDALFSDPLLLSGFLNGLACIVIMILCLRAMPKRTPYGNEILGKITGFKTFLETAEKPKLEELVMLDPEYFYNILPYTYVLGISDTWIEKFESIALQAPSWHSSRTTFGTAAFGRFINTTMSSASSAMSSRPSSSGGGSSGGGSSGGGSSGGGSGGGGGGSW